MRTIPAADEEAVARYVAAAGEPHATMRALAVRLSGLVLLATLDSRDVHPFAETLASAGEVLAEAEDTLRAIAPPPACRHHLHHLLTAVAMLRRAAAEIDDHRVLVRRPALADACKAPLDEAIAHLRHAARLLPHFEMVDLGSACCAWHEGLAPVALV